jgi:Co/Zn/Cd efflux system component
MISAEGATKNTIVINAVLVCIKLFTGLVSGSSGVLVDGVDATIDTILAGRGLLDCKKEERVYRNCRGYRYDIKNLCRFLFR